MKKMKTIKFSEIVKIRFLMIPLALILTVGILTSCSDDDDVMEEPEKNIVEVAADAGQFNILIQAAQKAGLANFLSTENNITVFAPTDEAFATLLDDLGLSSLDEVDNETLAGILKYHVVDGKVSSGDLTSGAVPSLNMDSPDGKPLSLLVNVGGDVMINNAKVTSPNVMASNGIIHVVNKVLLPPSVVDLAIYTDQFSTLVSAVVKADLVDALSAAGPFTVFAPTNDAFIALLSDLELSSLDDVSKETLTGILTYHVVGDNVLSTELSSGSVNTLSQKTFEVAIGNEVLLNGSVKVVTTDIQGTNGVIHIIDKVLLPE